MGRKESNQTNQTEGDRCFVHMISDEVCYTTLIINMDS